LNLDIGYEEFEIQRCE